MSDKKVLTMLERMGMVRKVDDESEGEGANPPNSGESETVSDSGAALSTAVPDDFWDDSPQGGTVSAAAAASGFMPATPRVSGYTSTGAPVRSATGAIPLGGAGASPPARPPEPKPVDFTPASDSSLTAAVAEPELEREREREREALQPLYGATGAQDAGSADGPAAGQAEDGDAEPSAAQPVPQAAPAQTYTDRYMEVDDLYTAFSMKTSGTDTIYLIEEYMKTLPDSLPAESRRTIIMKIIGASGFDFDHLLSDGIDRVNKLNEYAGQFAQRTDDYVARCNTAIDSLEQQVQQIRAQIEKRKSLHKQQFFSIETEAQRLKEILDFITK